MENLNDLVRWTCACRLESIYGHLGEPKEIKTRIFNELDNANEAAKRRYQMLLLISREAEKLGEVISGISGSPVDMLLCSGSERLTSDEFEVLTAELPGNKETEITAPPASMLNDLSRLLSKEMEAEVNEIGVCMNGDFCIQGVVWRSGTNDLDCAMIHFVWEVR